MMADNVVQDDYKRIGWKYLIIKNG